MKKLNIKIVKFGEEEYVPIFDAAKIFADNDLTPTSYEGWRYYIKEGIIPRDQIYNEKRGGRVTQYVRKELFEKMFADKTHIEKLRYEKRIRDIEEKEKANV